MGPSRYVRNGVKDSLLRGSGYLYSKWIVTRVITSISGLHVP